MADKREYGNYAVGYGRPPKSTQFTPGKSGNPKGRPRGSRSIAAILKDVVNRKVTVSDNGKTRRVPAIEAMLHRLTSDGLKGDLGALKILVTLSERYADSPETKIKLDDLLAEDREILAQYAPPTGSPADLNDDPLMAKPTEKGEGFDVD